MRLLWKSQQCKSEKHTIVLIIIWFRRRSLQIEYCLTLLVKMTFMQSLSHKKPVWKIHKTKISIVSCIYESLHSETAVHEYMNDHWLQLCWTDETDHRFHIQSIKEVWDQSLKNQQKLKTLLQNHWHNTESWEIYRHHNNPIESWNSSREMINCHPSRWSTKSQSQFWENAHSQI